MLFVFVESTNQEGRKAGIGKNHKMEGSAMGLEFEELTGKIIGAAIEVHRELGPGFLESIYENALFIELQRQGLHVAQQMLVPVHYRGQKVGQHRLDLLVDTTIIVELKTAVDFEDVHYSIVRSYLKAMKLKHGLLLNFAKTKLDVRRVILQ